MANIPPPSPYSIRLIPQFSKSRNKPCLVLCIKNLHPQAYKEPNQSLTYTKSGAAIWILTSGSSPSCLCPSQAEGILCNAIWRHLRPAATCSGSTFMSALKGLPAREVAAPSSCFKLSTENGVSRADSQPTSRIQKAREALSQHPRKMGNFRVFHDRKLIALEMLLKRAVCHPTLNSDKCLLNAIKVITVMNTLHCQLCCKHAVPDCSSPESSPAVPPH